jgi:CxxC motif-containing protein (DUF1111 family)
VYQLHRLKVTRNELRGLLAAACVLVTCSGLAFAQRDPGVRGGAAGAGGAFPSLNSTEQSFFTSALGRFGEVDSVSGTIEAGSGLGPTFNGNSCAQCHAQPAVGGTSPAINPQVANNFAHLHGASNPADTSGFLSLQGPIREVRFVLNPDGTPDGGVHGIFTIAGRTDAPGCVLAQPDFVQAIANHNAIFRIPTPVFGLGLLEAVPDDALVANLASNAAAKANLNISGHFNRSGNDGSITRFGWKAQNKSLVIFAGEAYNVEQGVSNEIFPNERGTSPGCQFNSSPEDATVLVVGGTPSASKYSSDTVNFAAFMRLSAAPAATTSSASQVNGRNLFNSIGCALCHSPNLTTGNSPFTGMSNFTFHPYTDLALHHMGQTLADSIFQGNAAGDEFRSAPLWGLGQRVFFLHDGRTSDLLQAIAFHFSDPNQCEATASAEITPTSTNGLIAAASAQTFCGSEANGVIQAFNGLSSTQKQDVLNFLRSL